MSRQPGRLSTHPPSKEITPRKIWWREWSTNLVFWAGIILWTAVETPEKIWLLYMFEIWQTATYQLKFLVMHTNLNVPSEASDRAGTYPIWVWRYYGIILLFCISNLKYPSLTGINWHYCSFRDLNKSDILMSLGFQRLRETYIRNNPLELSWTLKYSLNYSNR